MKKIELWEHFTCGKMVRYALPAIISIIVTTSFGLVDGFFVSNLLGVTPFAAVNLIYPALSIFPAIGFMIGSGGSAVISDALGRGDQKHACELFSMAVAVALGAGVLIVPIGYFALPILAKLMGADEILLSYCVEYAQILVPFLPAFILTIAFNTLWITAGKAWLGLAVSTLYGASNAFLDWLLMGYLRMGIRGAGLATALATLASASIIFLYFMLPNSSDLRLGRFKWRCFKELPGILFNGASEMLGSVATTFAALVVNARILLYFGEIGVDAMGIFSYVFGLFAAFSLGIASTTVTVVGYKHGHREFEEINSVLKKGIVLMLGSGVLMYALCMLFAEPFVRLFIGYDAAALKLSVRVYRVMAPAFILFGFNRYASSMFTGLGDGLSSLIISACETLVAPITLVFLLPTLFGANSIWFVTMLGTIITAVLSVLLLCIRYRTSLYRQAE